MQCVIVNPNTYRKVSFVSCASHEGSDPVSLLVAKALRHGNKSTQIMRTHMAMHAVLIAARATYSSVSLLS